MARKEQDSLQDLEGPSEEDLLAVEAFASSQEGDYALSCVAAWEMLEEHDEFVNSL